MSELILVAVPSARAPGNPRLRVVVVPRLHGSLEAVGMSDWPTTLRTAPLVVEVQLPTGALRRVRHTMINSGRSELWRDAFGTIDVVPAKSQRVYPVPQVSETSRDAARVVETFGTSAKELSTPGAAADEAVEGAVLTWDEPEPVPPPEPVTGPLERVPQPDLDFHASVAYLREHPTVLRALGLIFELDLTVDSAVPEEERLPRSRREAPHLIRVTWPAPAVAATITSPWTAYESDGALFVPQAAGDIRDGLVDLDDATHSTPPKDRRDGRWEVATFDVDGGAAKLRDAARALTARRRQAASRIPRAGDPDRTPFTEDRQTQPDHGLALPSLRSAGLVLIRRGRGEQMALRSEVARANAARASQADGPPLRADDLLLGYRVDVKPQGESRWRSLCRREGEYTVAGHTVAPPDLGVEEGHIKARAAVIDHTQPRRGDLPTLVADEVVARWSGWSLAVPRPVLDRSGERVVVERKSPLPFELSWQLVPPPGSLPRLRFGGDYRVRLRAADIAGGGLEADQGENDGATDLIGYGRYEPIPPPQIPPPTGLVDGEGVFDPEVLGPGGAVDQLVVRSDPNATDPVQAGADLATYPRNQLRDVLPPSTRFEVAEQHGVLDRADQATWQRAARAMNLTGDGVPAVETDEAIQPLPDPAAAGVAAFLHDVDEAEGSGELADDAWGPWPTDAIKHLRLVAGTGDGGPTLAWQAGTAVVTLPPAAEATIELSSYVLRDDLSDFAIKKWLPATGEDLAVKGRHPMVTPPHTLRLVHAVRRPLRPAAGSLDAIRALGQTSVQLTLPAGSPLLDINPPSTAQLDITAEWDDVIDDPTRPGSHEEHRTALVRSIVVTRTAVALPPLEQDMGDTRHQLVTYKAMAKGRFEPYFDASDPELHLARSTLDQVHVISAARPDPPTVVSVVPAFRWEGRDVPAGWSGQVGASLVRVRRGGRLRIEVARPWFSSGRDERLAVITRADTLVDGPPDEVRQYLSEIGRDPIYDATGVFFDGDPLARDRWIQPQHVHTAGGSSPIPLAELGPGRPGVVARPYAVSYEGGRCFVDVVITGVPERTYCPLARLAVARYQKHSIAGSELSTVVRLEPLPLLPDRTLTLERVADGLRVTLAGRGPASPLGRTNRVVAMIERLDAPPGTATDAVALAALGADAGGVPAWVRVAGHRVTGGLDSPLPVLAIPAGDQPLRLYVREVERFLVGDAGVGVDTPAGGELTERAVFADTVTLL